jgi:hypothetical protein
MDESTNSPSFSEQSSDNVIPFPTRVVASISDPETPENNEEANRKFLDGFVHDLALHLLSEFHEEGFDIHSTTFDKNFGFAVESLRSTLYATYDIAHPFQEIVDKCVKFPHANDDDDEEDPS